MRVLSSLILAVLLASVLALDGAQAQGGLKSFAVGGGSAACAAILNPGARFCPNGATVQHFAFAARCEETPPAGVACGTPGTTTPGGYVVLRFADASGRPVGQVQGRVVCLSAAAASAAIGVATINFQVEKASGIASPPAFLNFNVSDSGQGRNPSDSITAPFTGMPCTITSDVQQVVTRGNIVVRTDVPTDTPLLATPLQSDWYRIDSSGNLYILENGTWHLMG
jgi:hypothetical protein